MAIQFEAYEYKWSRAAGGNLVRTLLLPPSVGHRRAYEEAQRRGVRSITSADVGGRRVDDPLGGPQGGQTAVWHRDERKAAVPLMLYTRIPGRKPLLVPNTQGKGLGDLKDQADEHYHYGHDRMDIPAPMPDYNVIMRDLFDLALRHQQGKHTYGPTGPKGLLTKDG